MYYLGRKVIDYNKHKGEKIWVKVAGRTLYLKNSV